MRKEIQNALLLGLFAVNAKACATDNIASNKIEVDVVNPPLPATSFESVNGEPQII